jgi:hypothetical protein
VERKGEELQAPNPTPTPIRSLGGKPHTKFSVPYVRLDISRPSSLDVLLVVVHSKASLFRMSENPWSCEDSTLVIVELQPTTLKIGAAFSVLSEPVPYSYFTEPYVRCSGRARVESTSASSSSSNPVVDEANQPQSAPCSSRTLPSSSSPQSHLTSISSSPAKQGVGNWLRHGRALQSASLPLFSTTGLHSLLLSKGGRVLAVSRREHQCSPIASVASKSASK